MTSANADNTLKSKTPKSQFILSVYLRQLCRCGNGQHIHRIASVRCGAAYIAHVFNYRSLFEMCLLGPVGMHTNTIAERECLGILFIISNVR